MKITLVDPTDILSLAPLTLMRNAAELRYGIHTLKEKWEKWIGEEVQLLSPNYLQVKYKSFSSSDVYVRSTVVPTQELVHLIEKLKEGEVLSFQDEWIAIRSSSLPTSYYDFHKSIEKNGSSGKEVSVEILRRPWQLFQGLAQQIENDIELFHYYKVKQIPGESNTVLGDYIYAQHEAEVTASILNASAGPIFLGAGSKVMEGSIIKGPFALCESATVKMGAKIYGPTVIGPHSKVGGEVNNSLIQGYSNKGHDGFLGNSILMEWCNLGADTNTSNLKNNYGEVKVYDYLTQQLQPSGQQFCGLLMGDHAKTGINTMLNTGTVVGVSANIFGAGFPPKFIPSFAWGGSNKEKFDLNKAFEVATRMMERRNVRFSDADRQILTHLYQTTS